MEEDELRAIPGYENYGVNRSGTIISFERNLVLSQFILDGYNYVTVGRGSLTSSLSAHRATALAWVENPHPEKYNIVNHIDGIPSNLWYKNLEWTDYSGNNYHAVNTGLRTDNIPCKVRNFTTKEISEFPSLIQAAQFMGLDTAVSMEVLRPKQFGKLIKDKYEFRFVDDSTPWFYENRTKKVIGRYMVTITHEDGRTEELFSNRRFLFDFKLYHAPFKSMPELAKHAATLYPNKTFAIRDSYTEERFRQTRQGERSFRMQVKAVHLYQELTFESLTQCANHFKVDRSSIKNRLDNGKDLDGWTFVSVASPISNGGEKFPLTDGDAL